MRVVVLPGLCAVFITACLPWDPRSDRMGDGGTAGGSSGGTAGGSSGGTAGGAAGGTSGGSSGGTSGGASGGTAGGSAGGTAGGTGGGNTPVPLFNVGFAGDYRTDGGCTVGSDGGLRCHPWCVPSPADAGKPLDAGCCLDDECLVGHCEGGVSAGNRRCVAGPGSALDLGASCGDPNDCNINQPLFCDVRTQRCQATIASTLGDDGGLLTTFLSSGNNSNGSLLPNLDGFSCALPGASNSSPCCYDRELDGGRATSCLITGSCSCTGSACSSVAGYTCPF
ncbi:MAG: hypothetical protein INH37_22325 [Myxococcaceae bacterium]|nr:hypothetical protein [Myxococcaceae bacterium]